jgi:hypothetical protein
MARQPNEGAAEHFPKPRVRVDNVVTQVMVKRFVMQDMKRIAAARVLRRVRILQSAALNVSPQRAVDQS